MRFELELVVEQHKHFGLPVRAEPPESGRAPADEVISRRRVIRAETDDLITCAMQNANLPALALHLGRCAFVTAWACAQFGVQPDVADFISALRESVMVARKALDDALRLQDWPDVRINVVLIEIAIRGAAAALNLPYEALLRYMQQCYLNNEEVTEDAVRRLIDESRDRVRPAE